MATIAANLFPTLSALSDLEVSPRDASATENISAFAGDAGEWRVFRVNMPGLRFVFKISIRTDVFSKPNQLPGWVSPTFKAIHEIQQLSNDWDSYGAHAIKQTLIGKSLDLLALVMEEKSPAPSVVPLSDGGLQLEWHRRSQDLEIIFSVEKPAQFFYRNRATGEEDEGSVVNTARLTALLRDLS